MPKLTSGPHFDAGAILEAVQQQDIGLAVSTNNPSRFRAILYAAMRAAPHLRCFVYADPRSAQRFALIKRQLPIPSAEEPNEDE